MAKTALWLVEKKAPDLFKVLRILLNGSAEYSLDEPPEPRSPVEKPDVIGLIPWFSLRDGAFVTDLCALWKEGCRRFVLVTPSPEHPLPWAKLPAHLRTAFGVAIGVCDKPSWEELKQAVDAAKCPGDWANRRVQEYAEARLIYDELLYRFSHGYKTDLSNQFLAPARLLLMDKPELEISTEWKKAWAAFEKDVLSNLVVPSEPHERDRPAPAGVKKAAYGSLGQELAWTASKITASLNGGAPLTLVAIENLMTLLTAIRVSAGVRTQQT